MRTTRSRTTSSTRSARRRRRCLPGSPAQPIHSAGADQHEGDSLAGCIPRASSSASSTLPCPTLGSDTSSATSRSRGRDTTIAASSSRTGRPSRVLEQAAELGYRWCLVQRAGNIILERWEADGAQTRLDHFVSEWIAERDFLALGAAGNDHCLLVDVRRWDELGRPEIRSPLVDDVGDELDGRCVALGRLPSDERSRLARYMGTSIGTYDDDRVSWQDPRTGDFLQEVQRQVAERAARRLPLESRAARRRPQPAERLRAADYDALQRGGGLQAEHDPRVTRLRRAHARRLLRLQRDGRSRSSASCSRSGTAATSLHSSPASSGTCRHIPRTTTCGTAPRRRRSTPERRNAPGNASSRPGAASGSSRSTGRGIGGCVTSSSTAMSSATSLSCSLSSSPSGAP